jgi:GntR family transcriptional regulator, arabinose operon transcriptional repressor
MSHLDKKLILSEIVIDKNSPEPFHLQLYKTLKKIIVKHRLEAGCALPSERQLSNKFELNRNTVHRAYQTLQDEGFVSSRPGSRGLFISEDAKNLYQPSFPCIGILLTCSFSDFVSKGSKLGMNYLSGVVDRANELNYSTMIVNLPHINTSKEKVLEWRNDLISRLSGVIYFGDRGIENDFAFESLVTYKNLPHVFVSANSTHTNVSSVIADVRSGGMAAAEFLRENGHSRVGMILPMLAPKREWGFMDISGERQDVMKKCFETCGIQVKPEWIAHECNDLKAITQQLDLILSSNDAPTAFWCQNDLIALRALDYFKARNIRVPEDISLFGFDDIEEAARVNPPLTSIRAGTYTIGRNAIDLVINLFENGRPGESRNIKVPTSLSCRQSISKVKHELMEV